MSIASNLKRIQIVKNNSAVNEQSEWISRFLKKAYEISKSDDPKAQNYSEKNLDLLNHLSFDLLAIDDNIIAFCGIYNGHRFPTGVFRILNRCYVAPDHRVKKLGNFSQLNSQKLLPIQLQEFQQEIKLGFASREGINGHLFLEKWSSLQKNLHWTVSDHLYHVAPQSNKSTAFQHICYYGDPSYLKNIHHISPAVWKARYL